MFKIYDIPIKPSTKTDFFLKKLVLFFFKQKK